MTTSGVTDSEGGTAGGPGTSTSGSSAGTDSSSGGTSGGSGDGASTGGGDSTDGGSSSGGGATTDGGDPAGSCGMGGPKREVVQVNLGDPDRWYLLGAPETDEPLPLVMAFHGDEGDPNNSTRWIWGNYWERNDLPFIVVMTKCPGCTSWYQGDTDKNADYVWEVLADVAANHNVDVNRIYAVGYSGGSEFLALHGFEFQAVFAAIQWTCGGNAYSAYTEPPRPDCKVNARIVISADDFLWDGAQRLLQRLEDEGHDPDFVEAQCSGHCCDTPDDNEGAWAWFQQHTKCDGLVIGECASIQDLP